MNSLIGKDFLSFVPFNWYLRSNRIDNDYIKLYNIYRSLFSEYIIKKYDLKKYDKLISDSVLQYKALDSDKVDCYQYFTFDDLKFFYVRNNIYIERLSDGDKEFLLNNYNSDDIKLDEKATEIIERTYNDLIREQLGDDNNDKEFYLCMGPESKSFLVPNNSIVIGFNYDEFADTNTDDDTWSENHTNQLSNLYKTLNTMILKFNKGSKTPIAVLKYDEYSIVRRKV